MVLLKIPRIHKCGTTLEEKTVPVNEKILSIKDYIVSYCPKCKIYKINNYESKEPEIIGDIITEAQAQTNIINNKSIYTKSYLEKIANKTNKIIN